jgi:hypothetical protein
MKEYMKGGNILKSILSEKGEMSSRRIIAFILTSFVCYLQWYALVIAKQPLNLLGFSGTVVGIGSLYWFGNTTEGVKNVFSTFRSTQSISSLPKDSGAGSSGGKHIVPDSPD